MGAISNQYIVYGPVQPATQPPSVSVGAAQPAALANQSQAWLQQAPYLRRCELSILLPISAAYNAPRSLMPMMLLEGSPQAKARISQAVAKGIEVNASTAGDSLLVQLSAPSGQEAALAQTAFDILLQPQLDPLRFKTLRDNLITNLRQSAILGETQLNDAVSQKLYGAGHPYSTTVNTLTQQLQVQTPQSVLSTYQTVLANPAKAKLMWVSSLPVATQQALLNQQVQRWQGQGAPLVDSPTVPQTPSSQRVLMTDNTLKRAHLVHAWQAPNVTDPDYPAFLVLLSLLDGFSGRFFKTLRTQQGLVYSTNQTYQNYQNAAEYRLQADVDLDKVEPALKGINSVIKGDLQTPGLLNTRVTEAELTRAKKQFVLGVRGAIQSANGIGNINLPRIQQGQPPQTPEAFIASIFKVNADDVQRVARRVFGPQGNHVVGVVAPQPVIDKLNTQPV
jgi:predicted Zn-dependent peptidase